MLEPGLQQIGLGARTDAQSSPVVLRFGLVIPQDINQPSVLYPSPGQTGLALEFSGEFPDPIPVGAPRPAGLPITVSVYGAAELNNGRATLFDQTRGQVVDAHVFTKENPALADKPQVNQIAIFAKNLLRVATTYRVEVFAQLNFNVEQSWVWSFTTLVPPDIDSDDVPQLDTMQGKYIYLTGNIQHAGTIGDGNTFAIVETVRRGGMNFWFSPQELVSLKRILGLNSPEALVGRRIRSLGRVQFTADSYNLDAVDGEISFA